MLACRPVEWPDEGLLASYDPTPIYPGSVVGSCNDCGGEVYIGPTQQDFQRRMPDLPVYCFPCVPKHADQNAYIHDLGNPYKPE